MFRTALLLVSLLFTLSADTDGLAELKKDAIVIGEGPTDAYVFADPKCTYSQDLIDTVVHSVALRKRFRYHIFLFNMPQVDSSREIDAIYAAPAPGDAMRTYMLDHQPLKQPPLTPAVRKKIERIQEAAEWLQIEKTPFIVIDRNATGH